MKTAKQEEMIHSFVSAIGEERRPLYQELILHLSDLGYRPKKERSNITFKHNVHNKQMVKMGFRNTKGNPPFFALRFSACKGYSQRFVDIVGAAILKSPSKAPGCPNGRCNFCAGEPNTHIYTHTFSDGERRSHCGAYALEIPDITANDIAEIKHLIQEEHEYLLKHEVNRGGS